MRTRVFIDFWNFQLNWNERANAGQGIDWPKVPGVFLQHAAGVLSNAGLGTPVLQETRVYASCETTPKDRALRGWLNNFLDRLPGFSVFVHERRWRKKKIHCRECGTDHEDCPACRKPFGAAVEKSVDTSIVTDLMSLAWDNTYDLAILLSSDKDFVPAVRYLQTKNFKVVNATWRGHGFDLATESWASFELDRLMPQLIRNRAQP